jgi:hypothetical protein
LNNSMTVYPLLGSVGLSQTTVSGGQTITGAVFLNMSAPAGGIVVSLSSSDTSVATVPPAVFVPAGLGAAGFTIHTSAVTTSKTTQIQAAYGGATAAASLTALP